MIDEEVEEFLFHVTKVELPSITLSVTLLLFPPMLLPVSVTVIGQSDEDVIVYVYVLLVVHVPLRLLILYVVPQEILVEPLLVLVQVRSVCAKAGTDASNIKAITANAPQQCVILVSRCASLLCTVIQRVLFPMLGYSILDVCLGLKIKL